MRYLIILLICCYFSSCKQDKEQSETASKIVDSSPQKLSYAKGFSITQYKGYKQVVVNSPWPKSKKTFTYILVKKGEKHPELKQHTRVIEVPIKSVVALSTTNIPTLEYLEIDSTLIGFPNTKYICSKKTRTRIAKGEIKELGINTELNIESLLELNPELVIGFSVNGIDKKLELIEQLGIPVVIDGAWTEQHPLGKAEWIKFTAAFYNKEAKADSIFKTIEANYNNAKTVAKATNNQPVIMSGSTFKDVWNIPGGKSFIAKYLEDANTNYLWRDNTDNGSQQLNFESVLAKGQNAPLWIGAGSYKSRQDMIDKHKGYAFFDAFKNKNIFTYNKRKSHEGGLLYFELGGLRPDLILKDIIKIAHPEVLTNYDTFFFKRLE